MTLCDYQILEYTTSELRTHGIPFVVILRLHAPDSPALTGYVMRNWEGIVKVSSRNDRDDIRIFIQDFRDHIRKQPFDTSLFDRLAGLSIGPIRAFVSGSCSVQDLDTVISEFFADIRDAFSWRECFDNLKSDL
jgi:hypothetical protein